MPPQTENFHMLKTIGSFLADGNTSDKISTQRTQTKNFDESNRDCGGHRESFT